VTGCFFAHRGPCDGPMDKAHLIPKARIRKELTSRTRAFDGSVPTGPDWRGWLYGAIWDPRVIVAACRAHHSAWDNRVFNIARGEVPQACEEYAEEYGLTWSLDRDYGERR
jgi:hypothetical protein